MFYLVNYSIYLAILIAWSLVSVSVAATTDELEQALSEVLNPAACEPIFGSSAFSAEDGEVINRAIVGIRKSINTLEIWISAAEERGEKQVLVENLLRNLDRTHRTLSQVISDIEKLRDRPLLQKNVLLHDVKDSLQVVGLVNATLESASKLDLQGKLTEAETESFLSFYKESRRTLLRTLNVLYRILGLPTTNSFETKEHTIGEVLNAIGSGFAKYYRPNISMDAELKDSLSVNLEELETRLMNLVSNALELSGNRQVGVTTHIREWSNISAQLSEQHRIIARVGLRHGRYLGVSVEDKGPGMSAEVLASIFANGVTHRVGGTGLGLANVYEYVKELNGFIEVNTVLGSGSKFTLWLPLSSTPALIEEVPVLTQSPKTMIVIDDDRSSRAVVSHMAKKLGFVVAAFNSFDEAMPYLTDVNNPADVIVSDYNVPGNLKFADMQSRLNRSARAVPIIVSSGDRHNPQELGVAGVLPKPLKLGDFKALVEKQGFPTN